MDRHEPWASAGGESHCPGHCCARSPGPGRGQGCPRLLPVLCSSPFTGGPLPALRVHLRGDAGADSRLHSAPGWGASLFSLGEYPCSPGHPCSPWGTIPALPSSSGQATADPVQLPSEGPQVPALCGQWPNCRGPQEMGAGGELS